MSDRQDDQRPPSQDARTRQRSSIFLTAVMRTGTEESPVKVRNISTHGAMIETSLKPTKGSTAELIRGPLSARGTVVWSEGNRCGLRFASEVSVKEWLASPTVMHQQRVDEMVALVKAGRASGVQEATAGPGAFQEAGAREQLVHDLEDVVRLMQDLEDELASSDETLERHGMKLQNLDIAMQMLRAVSSALKPDDDKGDSMAKLEVLRVACAKALGTE